MSKFLGGMDNYTPASSKGENGHTQYSWAKSEPVGPEKSAAIEEQIVQISFQLVRTKGVNHAVGKYKTLLTQLKNGLGDPEESERIKYYIGMLIKMCAHTRDIVSGKGEYSLAYSMLGILNDLFPEVAFNVMRNFVLLELDGVSVHPYGSWKDIKCFMKYSNKEVIRLVNDQLMADEKDMKNGKSVSLAGKWVPREGSKYGGFYEALACDYYSNILDTSKEDTRSKAINMCKMNYRKLLSSLNRHLDTTQVKQCGGKWSEITPEKVTSVTLFRNKKAFLNVDKKGNERNSSRDRVECAKHFKSFLARAKEGKVEVKGKRIGLNEFTKEALDLIPNRRKSTSEIDMLNLQWKNNSKQNGKLGNFVPLVDVSGSMAGDPLHAAIALGIRVAEKSRLGKRVLTFTDNPKWVNLEGKDNFVDMVEVLKEAEWGMTTNFAAALRLILAVIKQQKMSAEEAKEISLVIFSDMMINQADKNYNSMYDMIEKEYADAGVSICGEPYSPPHILFWNLRSTSGFPSLTKQKNTSMLSGFSPVLLNSFCEKGIDCLDNLTPWSLLLESLNNPRYNVLDDVIEMIR